MGDETKETKLQIIANTHNWIPVIKLALEGTEGVEKAEVDIQYATVLHDPEKATVEQLVSIVTKAGKDCVPVS